MCIQYADFKTWQINQYHEHLQEKSCSIRMSCGSFFTWKERQPRKRTTATSPLHVSKETGARRNQIPPHKSPFPYLRNLYTLFQEKRTKKWPDPERDFLSTFVSTYFHLSVSSHSSLDSALSFGVYCAFIEKICFYLLADTKNLFSYNEIIGNITTLEAEVSKIGIVIRYRTDYGINAHMNIYQIFVNYAK